MVEDKAMLVQGYKHGTFVLLLWRQGVFMGVLLQAFFQQNDKGPPSPGDGDAGSEWWWDYIAGQAHALQQAGFSAIWLPPVTKGASGTESIGYDVFDDYDLGAKNQKGTVPTRYGSREQLQRCAAILRANGIDIYLDIVNHQRDGGNDFVYTYPGADGTAGAGRFPKCADDFHPNVPPDPYVTDSSLSFGDDLSPMNCIPAGYVFNALIDSCDWLTRTLDVQGYRFDDAKGISTAFTLPLATSKSMTGKFVVGELISPIGDISSWVFRGMQGKASAFDYPLHFSIAGMCNNPGSFDMTQLDDTGFTAQSPFNSVTFVENHDTDSSPSLQPVVTNKMLGYAFILTIEGYPSVYYRDYSTDVNCYGLKPYIDNLLWIHEKLASGATQQRWKDFNVFAYERLGTPGLLTALNNDPDNAHTITVATNFGPNVALHDYTGHSPDVETDENGSVAITVPQNTSGESYVCYSRAGITGGFTATPQRVRQDFDGAADLDILPATNGTTVQVGRIWCDAGSAVQAALIVDKTGWTGDSTITVELTASDGCVIGGQVFTKGTPLGKLLQTQVREVGFHGLRLTGVNLPGGSVPYTLSVSYGAPQG